VGRERTPQLIGREESLRDLWAALGRVDPPQGSLVLVSGEAGIGKTRLLEEFAGRIPDVLVARGGCVEDVAYAPWADALWWLLQHQPQATDGLPTRVRTQLARLLPSISLDETPADADEGGQQLLFESVVELLGHIGAKRQLVVVLDDVHWIDPASRELLRYVAGNLRRLPILLVVAFRADETERELITQLGRLADDRVELARLPAESTAQIATILLGDDAQHEDIERIIRNADGNPLFVEELVAAADTDRIPPTLRDLMLARFMLLDKDAQHLVRVAAVTGAYAPRAWLVGASQLAADDARLAARAAVDTGVLVAHDNGYAFRHALLREAVLDELLPDELVSLHRDIARTLDEDPKAGIGIDRVAELARHWDAAEEPEPALKWNVAAAQQAQQNYAFEAAYENWERALTWWDAAPAPESATATDHATLLLDAADAAHVAGHIDRAADLAQSGIDESFALDSNRGVEATVRAHPLLWNADKAEELFEYATANVLPVLETVDARARARFLLARADHISAYGTVVQMRDATTEMMESLDQIGDRLLEARAHIVNAWCLEAFGDYDLVEVEYERAAELARGAGKYEMLALALLNHASFKNSIGDLTRALSLLDTVDDLVDRYGLRRHFAPATYLRARVSCLLGDLPGARTATRKIDPLFLEGLSAWQRTSVHALIDIEGGDYDAALAQLGDAATVAPLQDAELGIEVAALQADALAWKGELTQARQVVDAGMVSVEQHPETYWQGWLAMVALRIEADASDAAAASRELDDVEASQARAARVVARWRETVAKLDHTIARTDATTLALEAEWARLVGEGARDTAAAAAKAFEAIGMPYYSAYFRWREAAAMIEDGLRPGATELLKKERSRAFAHGFEGLAEAMTALARVNQLRLGPARTTVDGDEALSVRELEVLRLMADGKSNPEIAETLFISRRTAAAHVSNILKKLDTSTRVEAVSEALRRGYV
jgi:DNA-binding CsgD family transcriptional regulator/tetratricopeptide (TPR) repeat protein